MKAEADKNRLVNEYADAIKPMNDLQEQMDKLSSQAMESYRKYARLEGLTAQLTFRTNHDKIVQDYMKANPQLRVQWQPIPIKEATFSATVMSGGNPDVLPSVIGASIPGIDFFDSKNIPTDKPLPSLGKKDFTIGSKSLPFGDVSGLVQLNLLGACEYYSASDKGEIAPIPSRDINNISADAIVNLAYTYETSVRRGFSAEYNMYDLVSRIETQSSGGGWFSSWSAHSLVMDHDSSNWFKINFDAGSSEFQYTAAEQSQITMEEKASLVDRLLRQIASPSGGLAPNITMPPQSFGAIYGNANGCPFYFCKFAGFFIGIANSIWGSSNVSSYFKSRTSGWARDDVSGEQIIDRSYLMTFEKPSHQSTVKFLQ